MTPAAEAGPAPTAEELAAGEHAFAQDWMFLKSVPALEHLPEADRAEIAFAGRSNVGKSSLINALVRKKGLARASNTPGRTQELNYFRAPNLRPSFYLVDMPGYGFAEAPKAKVEAWTRLVKDYLRGRPNLARVLLLIDARHGPKPSDHEIMTLLDGAAVAYQVLLTKSDKVPAPAQARVEAATREALARHPAAFPQVIATSADTGLGLAEVRARIVRMVAERAGG
jgi:GTP-binding protein